MDTTQKKNSKEWVGAPVALPPCERRKGSAGETFTSSERVLRPRSRTKLGEVQASDAKTVTELAIGSVRKSARIEAQSKRNLNSQTQIGPTNRKMSLSTQPEKHHRVILNENSNELPPSLDGGLSDNLLNAAYCHLRHQTRDSNSVDVDRKMETKIKFPPSNDKYGKKSTRS